MPFFPPTTQGVTILRHRVEPDEADCLYRDGEGGLQICATAEMLDKERLTTYYGSFTGGGGVDEAPSNTHLIGDAFFDRDFGVQLDGVGDYLTIDQSWQVDRYGYDGTFTISMWFSKMSECQHADFLGDRFETLFSHKADKRQSEYVSTNSNVNIFVGCVHEGHSTVGGNIIRTTLVDENGNQAVFDTSLDSAREGDWIVDEWAHMSLSVDHRKIQMIIDGQQVAATDIGYPLDLCDGCEAWVQTAANLAWPDPMNITGPTPMGR